MNKEPITLHLETFNNEEYILADECIEAIGLHRRTNTELHQTIEEKDKEIERLKDEIDKCDIQRRVIKDLNKSLTEVHKEKERLNNIINEFDKWLLGEKAMFYKGSDGEILIRLNETTSKWLELKGSDKE